MQGEAPGGGWPAWLFCRQSGLDPPEGEVEAFAALAQPGRQAVLPVGLGWWLHQQQVSIGQIEAQRRLAPGQGWRPPTCRRSRSEAEGARHPEAEGGDRMIGGQFAFVIGVPAHAVRTMAIAVQQQAVEAPAEPLAQLLAQGGEGVCPGQGIVTMAAVAVGAVGIAIPAHQSWNGVPPPEDPN